MKQRRERGDPARYHGQIGRSQTHYTVEDYPLMRQVFAENLWPILQETALRTSDVALAPCCSKSCRFSNRIREEKPRQKGVRVGAAPAAQEPAPMPARQPCIHEFFRNDGHGEM